MITCEKDVKYARVPRIYHDDAPCVILGGGPGLKLVDVESLRERFHVLAVNQACKLAPWADALFFGDCSWLRYGREQLRAFNGLRLTLCWRHNEPDVLTIRRLVGTYGLCADAGAIAWNKSSGAAAINLAYHLGARNLILVGFDMRKVDGENNWHQDYDAMTRQADPFESFLIPFHQIARDCARLDVRVVNATPGSALTHFPIRDPKEVLHGGCAVAPNHRAG